MKTIGIGVDIIDNRRIRSLLKNRSFIIRTYSKNEILVSKKILNKTNFFSKRFAAKEAFSKALGMGFRNSLNFIDISIINDNYGKPSIEINNKLKKVFKKKFKTQNVYIHLSISDENKHSIAFVILEKIWILLKKM